MMHRAIVKATVVLAMSVGITSCSPSPGDAAASGAPAARADAGTQLQKRHRESGLPVIPLTLTSGGQAIEISVEVARSRVEQAKGLMFRTEMGASEGMLFPFEEPREASFWMRNTVIPLDIIFVGTDCRILNIEADAVPYSEDKRRSDGVAIAVLELNGGRAAELGIAPGDKVDW